MANTGKGPSNRACDVGLFEFRVILKEIDRFYDFEYAHDPNTVVLPGQKVTVRRVATIDGKPIIVFGVWGEVGKPTVDLAAEEVRTTLGWRYHDEKGDTVYPQNVKLLHCDLQRSERGRADGRTFHRADSTPVKWRNWVYIFRSKPGCEDPRFYDELYFQKDGEFSRTSDSEIERSRREWERAVSDPNRLDEAPRVIPGNERRETELWLPMEILDDGGRWRACYYFYLAPFQLPWEAIEQIRSDLSGRAVSLDDDFYTDLYLTKRPQEVVPSCAVVESWLAPDAPRIAQLLARGGRADPKRDGFIGRVLHLPNPLKEGLHRASDLDTALRRHGEALHARTNDPKYRLARAIELFTSKDDGLRSIVAKKLDGYLYPEGFDRIDRLWHVAASHAQALVSWIGRAEQKSLAHWTVFPLAQPDVERAGRNHSPPEDPAPLPAWQGKASYCAFSDAVRYYTQAASGDREQVATIVATVHARLHDLPAGQAWLLGNLQAFLKLTEKELSEHLRGRGKPGSAYSGLDLVFAWNKKWGGGATTALTGIHWAYAMAWDADHKDLVKLVDEINREVLPDAKVEVRPRALNILKACAKTASGVRAMLTLAADLRKLHENRDDALEWFRVSGDVAKLIDTTRGSAAAWTTATTQLQVEVPKISYYAVYAGAVSLATGIMGFCDAHDSGERIAQAADVTGTVVALAACFRAAWAAPPGLVAWALQFTAKKIRSSYSDAGEYLYACEFGELPQSVLKGLIPLFPDSPERNRWVGLKKENPNAWTFERQYRELEKLAYDFDCSFKFERGKARHPLEETPSALILVMKPRYPHCLPAGWSWSVDLTVQVPGKEPQRVASKLQCDQAANAPATHGLVLHKDHSLSIELAQVPIQGFQPTGFHVSEPQLVAIEGTLQLTIPSSMTRDFKKSLCLRSPPTLIGVARLRSSWTEEVAKTPYIASQGVTP